MEKEKGKGMENIRRIQSTEKKNLNVNGQEIEWEWSGN